MAKLNFGQLLDSAQKEPVTITKKDRPVAVIISTEEYRRLEALEDSIWAARAEKALESGNFLTASESVEALSKILSE
jgi:prevent-host-death family protein